MIEKIIENLQAPLDTWAALLFVIIAVIAINKKADKAGTQFSKKNNLLTQLSKRVYKMPRQDSFDISIYGERISEAVKTYKDKLAAGDEVETVWKSFRWREKEAFVFSNFDFIQQFLNGMNEYFIIERSDETYGSLAQFAEAPYTAIRLNIYRADVKIGEIEIDPLTHYDEPTATIRCRLKYAEMFDYERLYNLFYKLASIHSDPNDPSILQKLEAEINSKLTGYLWDRLCSNAQAEYDGIDWHKFELLEMQFTGSFRGYRAFRSAMLDRDDPNDPFKFEATSIKRFMDNYGYEEI